ncbi:biopolymer transporter ExbD [Porticoccaceae bacterium]|nr:biopolymer transporter ExbD [Porticoccaceae bacterium]MDC0010622.1 biopolymer transporter ExbD [Porticoccaceae bacterium]MDC1452902.1 biopolymer transporter ExbD [Porticoccaceae bacterium]
MKFPRRPQRDNSINLTPLIDVVFLLLIFFMVTTTFTRETRMLISLPEAEAETESIAREEKVVELVVSKDGSYAVDGQSLINRDIKTIMAALKDASAGDSKIPLVITADALSTHQAVITAMDAAGRLGFETLNIATQQPQEP